MKNSAPLFHHLLLLTLCAVAAATPPSNLAYPSVSGDCSVSDGVPIPVRREVYDNGRIFDISHRYTRETTPSWDSASGLGEFLLLGTSMKNGSDANVSTMKFSVHSETHVDASAHVFDHYYDAGFDVDTLDLEVLNGPALLVDVPRDKNITAEVMKALNILKGVRHVLFRTLNTDRRLMWKKEFDTSYVGFTVDGAKWLVENTDIKLIAIPTHHVFLKSREIILVEGLKLVGVPALNILCSLLTLKVDWCRWITSKMHSHQMNSRELNQRNEK